jgi:general secretion pathway protein L
MASALEQKLKQLQSRVRTGPVGTFFSWWVEELRLALPDRWQEKLHHTSRNLAIDLDSGRVALYLDENHALKAIGTLPDAQDSDLLRQQLDDLLAEHELEEAPNLMLLDSGSILAREVSLPLATEANLAQVLTFEMDRQTPFKASAVYFDWLVMERDTAAGQLRLMLYVVPRAEVDEAVKLLAGKGIELAGVDVREDGRTKGLNLMPEDARHVVVNTRARVNYALGAAALVLLVAVMAFSLYLRDHQVSELESAIDEVRGEALQVDAVRKQIEGASEAAGFLAMRRAESPLAVELLADITRILPDDTYLDRLVIGRNTVQMQGKSRNAQQLIERVNESPYMSAAAFRGSTRLDARSGLEIFEINAQVTVAGGDDGAGS